MRIFGRKKKTEIPELTLVQVQESEKYHFFAALAKALLLFLLVYGALGGFLSAFEIQYNNGLCMLILLGMAILLSAVYESGRKWIINFVSIIVFIVYLYIAVSNYWVINSGYYAILNRIFEVARQYFDVDNGVEYALAVEETYGTITMFALFLGMVGIILLNIMLQYKSSLLKVVLLTLILYVIPFYFERSPDLIYILFLLTGYLAVGILQVGNVREKLTGQMCYVLPLAVVLTILVIRTVSFIIPAAGYESMIPKSARKEATEEGMARFAQYGLLAMMRQGSINAGVSGGRLSKGSAVMPTNETVLKVRYTPYDYTPVYLKAFTGKEYRGDLWTQAGDELPDDGLMLESVQSRMENYEKTSSDGGQGEDSGQGRGIMEVEKVDHRDRYEYHPYYTAVATPDELEKEVDYVYDPDTDQTNVVITYTYYPDVDRTIDVDGEVSDVYLDVPQSCRAAVAGVCEEAGFAGTEEEIAAQVVEFFRDNYSYTLRPGYYFGDPDYITHFLLESKRGYCAHFASAGTMLLRQMGIHARYVEGYAFSYYSVVETGELVEEAEYDDYYDGYAPLGETALIEMEIPDAYAHAWVEIYVDGRGWIVVDPTPPQTEQEDFASFWDAFMNGGGEDGNLDMAESNLGAYLENTLGGITYVLLGAAVLFLIVLLTVHLYRAYRESKLPARERVKLEYGRIQAYLAGKHDDYRKLRTLREQMDWIRDQERIEISGEQEETLYQVYFAENVNYDCEEFYRQLRKMRSILRYRKILPGGRFDK